MPQEDGFEYKLPGDDEATFFRWSLSDGGKDIMLIDRFTAMPIDEFFKVVEDSFDRSRGPILLAMIATSIRARFPDWTVERIFRTVQNLALSEVMFIAADEEGDDPPTESGETPTQEKSPSPSPTSSPSATQTDEQPTSDLSNLTPA